MPTTPGWYQDPTGLPFQRYWDGNAWTEHTDRVPSAPSGAGGTFATAKLPDFGHRPIKQWYQRKGVVIGGSILGVLLVFGAIGAAISPASKNTGSAGGPVSTSVATPSPDLTSQAPPTPTSTPTPTPTSSSSSKSVRRKVKPAPEPTSKPAAQTSAADAGSWTMPNEVGQVLQDAQDDIQSVSGDPVFFSHSHDLLGDRFQILDRDWKVCTQNVPRGTQMSAVAHVDFGVVKLDETCP